MTGTPQDDDWQSVCSLGEIPPGALHEVAVGNQLVLLVRREEGVRAFQGLCPHNFAPLSGGQLDGDGWLTCPRHLARFHTDDGRCGAGWALPALKRYAVRIVDGDVQLRNPLAPEV